MDNIRSRLAKGTFWITVTTAATNLLGLVSTIVLARLLMPADFGLVAIATTMLYVMAAVTDLSLSNALVQHSNPTEEHFHTAWSLNMARAIVISALFVAAAYPAALIYDEPRLIGIMVALGLATALSGASNPKLVVFERELDFRQPLYLAVGTKVAGFVAAMAVAIAYRSYWALVAGYIVSQVSYVALSYLLKPYRPRVVWKHARELWSFSIWLTFSQIVTTLNWRFDQLLIGWILGRTSLGYYTVGANLAALPTREAISPLTRTLFPAFSALQHDKARLQSAYGSAQALISAIAMPVAFGWALVADPMVRLTMGEKWLPAVIMVQIIACVAGVETLSQFRSVPGACDGSTTKDIQPRHRLFPGSDASDRDRNVRGRIARDGMRADGDRFDIHLGKSAPCQKADRHPRADPDHAKPEDAFSPRRSWSLWLCWSVLSRVAERTWQAS